MAFNYRPKSVEEILAKKKTFSQDIGVVYTFIRDTYGETIILDTTTQFKEVKIPRIIEDKDNIKTVKQKLSTVIDISKLKISFGNGSGAGGSKIDATTTAMQENATRFVCQEFIESSKMPASKDIQKIYPGYDDEWAVTFELQAKALKEFLKGKKGYEYSRDDRNGMMFILEDIALKKCGVRTKDNWNPADIYLVNIRKKGEIVKEITKIGNSSLSEPQRLDLLNDYMRKLFTTRDLIGVSLKKLGKTVRTEVSNVKKQQTLKDISVVPQSFKLDLDLAPTGEFNTAEMKFQIKAENAIINVQIRAFSGGVREKTQMDMTGAGAAAKLGKVSITQAIDPFLRTMSPPQKLRSGTEIPKVGQFTEATIKQYVDEQKSISGVIIGGSRIDYGKDDWETTLRNAIELEKDNNRTASQLSTKLQCFQWIKIFRDIESQNKLQDFLTILYFGAKKEYATAGPFLKIY